MENKREFVSIIKDLLENEKVNEMKLYRQHYNVSTFEHCLNVAYISYIICKKFKLDYVSMARGAMLHDLFLYDWRDKRSHKSFKDLHAFSHPKTALNNAMKICTLNSKEQDIIVKHMWPVTFALPKYKESYVITLADKISAIYEGINYYKEKRLSRKIYVYTYLVSCMLNRVTTEVI